MLAPIATSTVNNVVAATEEQNVAKSSENDPADQSQNAEGLDAATLENITNDVKANAVVTKNGNETTVTISDNAMELILAKNHVTSAPDYDLTRSAGKTTFKWYGNGNFDVYLSKNMLNKIRNAGFSSGFNIAVSIISIIAGVPGLGITTRIIKLIAGKIVGAALGQVGAFKNGRKFKFRNWEYKGWSYQ